MKVNNKPKRCQMENCKKKLSLTDYPCRCGKYFCSLHRLAEQHNCNFNFKSKQKIDDKIESMKCVQERIDKI